MIEQINKLLEEKKKLETLLAQLKQNIFDSEEKILSCSLELEDEESELVTLTVNFYS